MLHTTVHTDLFTHLSRQNVPLGLSPISSCLLSSQQSSHRTSPPHSVLNEQINVCAARSLVYCGTFSNANWFHQQYHCDSHSYWKPPKLLQLAETGAIQACGCSTISPAEHTENWFTVDTPTARVPCPTAHSSPWRALPGIWVRECHCHSKTWSWRKPRGRLQSLCNSSVSGWFCSFLFQVTAQHRLWLHRQYLTT